MNTRMGSWLALPFLLFLSGCPDGGGGGLGFESAGIQVAYVANSGSGDVSAYTINPATGALTAVGSPVALGGASPSSIAVSPNGSFAYLTASDGVHAFTINASTGALASVTGSPFPAGNTPSAVTVSPNSAFLYVSNQGSNNVSAYTINGTTGALTQITGPQASPFAAGILPQAVTVSPNNNFVYVANSGSNAISAFAIEASGALTPVVPTLPNLNPTPSGGTTPNGLAITPNGQFLYVSNGGSSNVTAFSINGTSGELAAVTGSPFAAGTTPSGITVEPNGRFLYAANGGVSGTVSAYTITAGTGVLVPLGAVLGNPFPAGASPSGIATPGRP